MHIFLFFLFFLVSLYCNLPSNQKYYMLFKIYDKMMRNLGGRRMLLIPIDQIYRPCKHRLATKFPDYKTTQSATIKCYLTEDFQTRCLKQNRMVKIMKHLTPSIKFHRYFFYRMMESRIYLHIIINVLLIYFLRKVCTIINLISKWNRRSFL